MLSLPKTGKKRVQKPLEKAQVHKSEMKFQKVLNSYFWAASIKIKVDMKKIFCFPMQNSVAIQLLMCVNTGDFPVTFFFGTLL